MFLKVGKVTQHVSDISGAALLFGVGTEATAQEAAECINRYVVNGDPRMHEANAEFNQKYGKPHLGVSCGNGACQ